jgi:pimeloyl-ACP methyl ester carboxylesterase/class 3 adenylate cyclase
MPRRQEAAMGQPETRFASARDVNIAYQVIGEGPVDLVWAWGFTSNIEVFWEEPSYAAFLRRLAGFARVVLFDRRGCGASDRHGGTVTATLEERMEDVLAVLDAVGSERASVVGISEGGNLAALLAATYPDRIASIIMYGTAARFLRDEDHPWGLADADAMAAFAEARRVGWGTYEGSAAAVQLWAPTMAADERFITWMAKHARQSCSRSVIVPLLRALEAYDLVDVFPAVGVPTLVLHRTGDLLIPVSHSRWIAEHVPDAHLVELAGHDHLPFVGDTEGVLAEIEEFLVGSRTVSATERRLATLVITDVAHPSTGIGDDARREVTAAYGQILTDHLARFAGHRVKHVGSGMLATFDGPARAIRCALGILDAAGRHGIEARVGIHTGECQVHDADIDGIVVDVATAVAAQAAAGEILASSTVRDLVAGSGILFGDPRTIEIDGIAGRRDVLPVLRHGLSPDTTRRLAIEQADVLRRDGEYWTVAYDGHVATLRDTKGVRDLARLLAAPHHELHVLDLGAEAGDTRLVETRQATEADDLHREHGSSDPILDDQARHAYKQRIDELQADIDDADRRGDPEASVRPRAELDALVDQLTAAYGLGHRPRRTPDRIERARKTVTRRIRDAIRRIERAHPALGRHLQASIRTGVFCSYAPERDIRWTVDSHR